MYSKDEIKNILDNTKSDLEDLSAPLELDPQPMSGMRKAIAKAMSFSHAENASFSGLRNMDISQIVNLRNELKEECKNKGIKLTYLAFIIKACALSIKEMPSINVRIDKENNNIVFVKNINIGIAVDTPKGLIVPVIKSADKLTVFQIAKKIDELAGKARDGKLTLPEIKEGTFTVSNFGSMKLDYATPIINSPESAILGTGNLNKIPIYVGDEIKPAWMMPFSMTCDHRVIDGADIGRFMLIIEKYFNDPIQLFK